METTSVTRNEVVNPPQAPGREAKRKQGVNDELADFSHISIADPTGESNQEATRPSKRVRLEDQGADHITSQSDGCTQPTQDVHLTKAQKKEQKKARQKQAKLEKKLAMAAAYMAPQPWIKYGKHCSDDVELPWIEEEKIIEAEMAKNGMKAIERESESEGYTVILHGVTWGDEDAFGMESYVRNISFLLYLTRYANRLYSSMASSTDRT